MTYSLVGSEHLVSPTPVLIIIGPSDRGNAFFRGRLINLAQQIRQDSAGGVRLLIPELGGSRYVRATRSDAAKAQQSPETALLFDLVDSLVASNTIDPDRLYLTGFNHDRCGVWDLLQRRPGLFAAAVPIGSGGDRNLAYRVSRTPLWIHHGSSEMIKAVRQSGGSPRFTPGKALDPFADSSQLRTQLLWMLAHRRQPDQVAFARSLANLDVETDSLRLPLPESFHLYLLMGQSNMAGRGKVEAEDRIPHPRILMYTKEKTWAPAREPLHFDRPTVGLGPGYSFAKHLIGSSDSITIGLIPCAVGETAIEDWQRDARKLVGRDNIYRNALFRAKSAMKAGVLKGVLWHQGESNNYKGGLTNYETLLIGLIRDVRRDLGDSTLPFILGEIAESESSRERGGCRINKIVRAVPTKVPHTSCVSSQGLSTTLHFDSKSYREMGNRYAEAIRKIGADKRGNACTISAK